MKITLNGKPHELAQSISISALAEALALGKTQFAIERNREIVPRSRWQEAMVNEGDAIEVVQFIGGG